MARKKKETSQEMPENKQEYVINDSNNESNNHNDKPVINMKSTIKIKRYVRRLDP